MIEQDTSERTFELDDHQQVAIAAKPKFVARMSLIEARATILAALKSLSECGYTRRVGMLAREVCGVKFGEYLPSEIMDWLRSSDFQQKFRRNRFRRGRDKYTVGFESGRAEVCRVDTD